tara:strand:+ start:2455 stop:2694 length:240 start_codon:yes stop_codon:yes gene_type:complete
MEKILSTYQDITSIIKDTAIRDVLEVLTELGADQHDKTKVVAVIESAFATHGANGYEVLQQTIISRVKTSTPRGRGKTK